MAKSWNRVFIPDKPPGECTIKYADGTVEVKRWVTGKDGKARLKVTTHKPKDKVK